MWSKKLLKWGKKLVTIEWSTMNHKVDRTREIQEISMGRDLGFGFRKVFYPTRGVKN